MTKKNKLFIFIIILFFILVLSSCLFPVEKENTGYVDNYDDAEEIDIKYEPDAIIIEAVEGAKEYIVEVDGIFSLDDLEYEEDAEYVYYYYKHNQNTFNVLVKIYNSKKKLIAYSEKEFKPLIINDLRLDKEKNVVTFTHPLEADGYNIINNYERSTIYTNEIPVDFLDSDRHIISVTPFSNSTDYYGVETNETIRKCEDVTGLIYDDELKQIKWDSPVYYIAPKSYFLLKINNEEYKIPNDERRFNYEIKEPTTLELTFVSDDNLIANSESMVKEVLGGKTIDEIDVVDGYVTWDKLYNYTYDYSIIVDGEVKSSGNTEYNKIDLYYYYGKNVHLSITPISDSPYNYFPVETSFDFYVYDTPTISQEYDNLTRKNTINISCDDENIIGYDINIEKDSEIISYSYTGAELRFEEYQFTEEGDYKFSVIPKYKELEDIKAYTPYESYSKTIERLSPASGFYTRGTNVSLYGGKYGLKVLVIENDEIEMIKLNKDFYYSFNNNSDEAVVQNLKCFYIDDKNGTSSRYILPSYEYIEINFTFLGMIKNYKLEGNILSWDYQYENAKFKVNSTQVDSNNIEVDFTDAMEKTYYVYAIGDDDNHIVEGNWQKITVYKHTKPDFTDISTDYENIYFTFEEHEFIDSYEIIINKISYNSKTNIITIPYGKVYGSMNVKVYGKGLYYESDYYTHTIKRVTDYLPPTCNNKNKTISWEGLNIYAPVTKSIYDYNSYEKELLYQDNVNEKSIDISSYDAGYYLFTLESDTAMLDDILYIGNTLIYHPFTVLDFEIEEETFGYKPTYYPAGVEDKYTYMNLLFTAEEVGTVRSYETTFKDYCIPDLSQVFDSNGTIDITFSYANKSRFEADGYFTITDSYEIKRYMKVTKPQYYENTIFYYWDNITSELTISIDDDVNNELIYTLENNGKIEYVKGDSPSHKVIVTDGSVEYSVRIDQQTNGNYIYLPYEFNDYKFGSYNSTKPITLTKLETLSNLYINYKYGSTNSGATTFLISSISFNNPNGNISYTINMYSANYSNSTGLITNKELKYSRTYSASNGYHSNSSFDHMSGTAIGSSDVMIIEISFVQGSTYLDIPPIEKLFYI